MGRSGAHPDRLGLRFVREGNAQLVVDCPFVFRWRFSEHVDDVFELSDQSFHLGQGEISGGWFAAE